MIIIFVVFLIPNFNFDYYVNKIFVTCSSTNSLIIQRNYIIPTISLIMLITIINKIYIYITSMKFTGNVNFLTDYGNELSQFLGKG